MPLAAPRAGLPDPNQLPPMKVRMRADASGNLVELSLNDRVLQPAPIAGSSCTITSPASSATAAWPPRPRSSSTATSTSSTSTSSRPSPPSPARVGPDGQIIKLVEKIKFSPPRTE